MQVSPSVRAVQIPETNPMHPQFTTIYLVGRGQVLTIDSGDDAERYRWMLRGYLAATEKAEIGQSAVTHFHNDHSANLRWLHDEFGAELQVPRATAPFLRDRLPENGVKLLDDGDELSPGGGGRLRAVPTPGHSADSVCFYLEDEGVLFTGDTILGASTTMVSDLAGYIESLRRLRSLPNLSVIGPGHGPLITEPVAYIDDYLTHREERDRQIVMAMEAAGTALTSWQIMERLYGGLHPRLSRTADPTDRPSHVKWERAGRLRLHAGRRRRHSPDELTEAQAEERAQREIIRKADEEREQRRRRFLFQQENPPSEEWEEPPRYELL